MVKFDMGIVKVTHDIVKDSLNMIQASMDMITVYPDKYKPQYMVNAPH
jgi:hypothetical protein